MAYADSFRINFAVAAMHRLTDSILDVSNSFHNRNASIHEIFYVSPPYYSLYWFERSYPNAPLNRDKGIFCLQRMNGIQEKQLARRQWNWLFDTVATNIIYNKITIDNAI